MGDGVPPRRSGVAEIAEELHQATLPAGGYADAAGQKVDQQFDEVG